MRLPDFFIHLRRSLEPPPKNPQVTTDPGYALIERYFKNRVWPLQEDGQPALALDRYIPLILTNFALRSLAPQTVGLCLARFAPIEMKAALDGVTRAVVPDGYECPNGDGSVFTTLTQHKWLRDIVGAIILTPDLVEEGLEYVCACRPPDRSIDVLLVDGEEQWSLDRFMELLWSHNRFKLAKDVKVVRLTINPSPFNRGYVHYASLIVRA